MFCRLICAQETILTAPYIVFRLCEIVVPARSVRSRVALRPIRAGFRIARPGLGLVCGCRELCVLPEVLPPEVDRHSTDIFICFCVVILPRSIEQSRR